MTTTRIQSECADLRAHIVLILILGFAIALRSMSIGGGDKTRIPLNIPTANDLQQDATQVELSTSGALLSISETSRGPQVEMELQE